MVVTARAPTDHSVEWFDASHHDIEHRQAMLGMLTPVIDGLVKRLVGALPAVYANPWTGACPDRRRRDNLINDVDARWMPRPEAAEEEPAGGFGDLIPCFRFRMGTFRQSSLRH
jgi:hypothetical protein